MSLGTILLIVVILMLIGVLPVWPHARSWATPPVNRRGRTGDPDRPVPDGTALAASSGFRTLQED